MISNRLAGHGMRFEGRVYLGDRLLGDGNGTGRTKCECGAWSPLLPSTRVRKMWHRQHKAAVRAAAGAKP